MTEKETFQKILINETFWHFKTFFFISIETKCYLNGIVAGTDCDKIFSKRLVLNFNESWYVLTKWEKHLVIETCNSCSFRKIFKFCQHKLSGIGYLLRQGKRLRTVKGSIWGKLWKLALGKTFAKNVKTSNFCASFCPAKVYPFKICSTVISSCWIGKDTCLDSMK